VNGIGSNAKKIVVPKVGHYPSLENTPLIRNYIDEFLKE